MYDDHDEKELRCQESFCGALNLAIREKHDDQSVLRNESAAGTSGRGCKRKSYDEPLDLEKVDKTPRRCTRFAGRYKLDEESTSSSDDMMDDGPMHDSDQSHHGTKSHRGRDSHEPGT